ncbi:MAG: PhoH family protein [Bacteroidales bacterium]|nr:PhoH family protein [Bacteroidales bacterium]MCF8454561.1 PhoH family protein [Bacteroidales bacterium]
MKKIFVVDTNVILHDYRSIYHFEDNDIVLPIVVLEELDKFKKGNDLINFHAREFTRELDKIAGDKLFKDGLPLGKGLGKLFIETGKAFSEEFVASFPEKTPDHRILAIADFLSKSNKRKQVILVSKDINLRMKAKSLGIQASDYETGKVQDIESLYRKVPTIENVNDEIINGMYNGQRTVPMEELKLEPEPKGQAYYILKGQNTSALARFNPLDNTINRVEKYTAYGIKPRNAEQAFAINALINNDVQLVALTGKAGTGKTLLALAAALDQRRHFKQIFLARPIVPLSNRDLGFLPGDVSEKIGPYMQPLFDNLSVIKHQFNPQSREFQNIEEMLRLEKLVITPLAYIRGRSLSDVFFIVDEAQNLTPHEVKTIITRAGEGTKMIFTGDVQQIDTPYLDTKSNGLTYLTDKMKDQNIFAHVHLEKGERSYLAELASDLL